MIKNYTIGFYAGGALASHSLEEVCTALKGFGYDAIELDRAWLDACPDDDRLLAQKKMIEEHGLVLSDVIIQLDYLERDPALSAENISLTKQYMKRCAKLGVKTVNLFTGPRPWIPQAVTVGTDISAFDAWKQVIAAFREIAACAEELDISAGLENVWGMLCRDFFTAQYLINRVASPKLGVNFDPSHDQLNGNTDMRFLINAWGREAIKHIHLKDAVGIQQRGRIAFPPLGEGYVDWKGFFHGLEDIGYDGVLSVEYEADGHLQYYLGSDLLAAAGESYKALEKIIGGSDGE